MQKPKWYLLIQKRFIQIWHNDASWELVLELSERHGSL